MGGEVYAIMSCMRIAVFTDIYATNASGGIASSVQAQKTELEKLGHEVVVFCPGLKSTEKNVVLVPSHKNIRINGAIMAKSPKKIIDFVIQKCPDFGEFDLVHVHYEASCSIAGVILAKMYNLPLVQTMHGREDMAIAMNVPYSLKTIVATVLNFAHGRCLPHVTKVKRDKFQAPTVARAKMWNMMVNHAENADVVITPSDHFAKKLEHYGVSRPILAVSNGVAMDLVGDDCKERDYQDGDVLRMIWNSRLSQEKRIMPFLQAVKGLKRPYILHIYGDGNQKRKAQKYAKRHHLKTKFYGYKKREQILEKMQKAHLAIMASYNFDTQGMTLLESEATGLPVFFCDPEMMGIVPVGSFIIAGGPEPEAMMIALENFDASQIKKMSAVMLKNQKNVMQDAQMKKLLKAYNLAKTEHKKVAKIAATLRND